MAQLNPNAGHFSCYIMGVESLLIQCADALLQRGHTILGIITTEDSIAAWATEHDLPVIEPGPDLAASLSDHPFDYFMSITNLSIIPDDVLALPRKDAINFHDGPLPRYAGLYATSWALINQERSHGITWHTIEREVDTGQILKQQAIPVDPGETAFSLNVKCYEAGIETFGELVDELAAGTVQPRAQDASLRTYFGKYKRPDAACTIDWTQPADQLAALVHALDFGPYPNPLGLPKIATDNGLYVVSQLTRAAADGQPFQPGEIESISDESIVVGAGDGRVNLSGLRALDGRSLSVADFVAETGLAVGDHLPRLDEAAVNQLTRLNSRISRHEEFWSGELATVEPFELPYAVHGATQSESADFAAPAMPLAAHLAAAAWPEASTSDRLVAGFVTYLARLTGNYTVDLALGSDALRQRVAGFESYFADHVPLHVDLDPAANVATNIGRALTALAEARQHQSYALDLPLRDPELASSANSFERLSLIVEQTEQPNDFEPPAGNTLTLLAPNSDPNEVVWMHNASVLQPDSIDAMQQQFATFLQYATSDAQLPLGQVPLLPEAELRQLLVEWNDTTTDYDRNACVHELFEAQVESTPDATALVFEDQQISYADLNARSNQAARHLQQLGVGPETLVGVYLDRSLDLMVALFGILKAGGAYVPLDPAYPADRIAFMVSDARLPVILTQNSLLNSLPTSAAEIVCIDDESTAIGQQPNGPVHSDVTPDNLAYIIYTSGSTGIPKGVMVKHGNVVNFFAGMDQRIPHERAQRAPASGRGVWLAVTSLSFDISVLELFWTLARGFKVVLYADRAREQTVQAPVDPNSHKHIDFSLFYFASDESEAGVTDKYRLLLEGARYADQHGFSAVWTPERHFHAFGGLYPNPSVASAAIAAITENVHIRAGSCVLPLHSPIRVAEEWSVVDNISQGRVGIAFAAGWQPNDFVLQPEKHADRKNIMFQEIETVRKLWRGETVNFTGPTGEDVAVSTLPRPIQNELPIWITAAGNPETFEMAGTGGYHVLTHLLGQDMEELAEKLAVYRQAWQAAGHPGNGHATLMLHTFVGDDMESVRETVRGPMTDYLRSAVALVRKAAWTFPTFKERVDATGKNPLEMLESADVSEEDWEALLAHAFDRYFETSGLFGTPESCLGMVNALKALDVEEIGCLIDFGVPSSTALAHLEHLNALRELADPRQTAEDEKYSIAAQIERHQVTHMQCTPSMASMLMLDEASRDALSTLGTLMVGGEAFPVELAASLSELVQGDVINMYGPTETTIWSSTHPVKDVDGSVSIGRPIANTELYILDEHLQPTAVGVAGELYIGGDGVVRGYLDRPELTAERFIAHPFSKKDGARIYRTGDLVRYAADGNIEFLGRTDHQVKIRGYRVELGEIETLLNRQPGIREAVVVAREDTPGNKQLAAYLIFTPSASANSADLRAAVQARLPEFMVPSAFVSLTNFPLTPNGKVDRNALPAPDHSRLDDGDTYVAPRDAVEEVLAKAFAGIVGVDRVSTQQNFFELGGHSLLAVQLITQLRETFMVKLPLNTLFDAPTVAGLATALVAHEEKPGQTETIAQIMKQVEEMSADEVGAALGTENAGTSHGRVVAEGGRT